MRRRFASVTNALLVGLLPFGVAGCLNDFDAFSVNDGDLQSAVVEDPGPDMPSGVGQTPSASPTTPRPDDPSPTMSDADDDETADDDESADDDVEPQPANTNDATAPIGPEAVEPEVTPLPEPAEPEMTAEPTPPLPEPTVEPRPEDAGVAEPTPTIDAAMEPPPEPIPMPEPVAEPPCDNACDTSRALCDVDCARDEDQCMIDCQGGQGQCRRTCGDARSACELDCLRTCDDCVRAIDCATSCD